jgi:glycosyltransferase involved in cell wall biosynthesis
MQIQTKQKILVITPGIPYPPVNGFKLKIFNMLKVLSSEYSIDLIIIGNEKLTDESVEFLNKTVANYRIFRYPKVMFFLNLFRALFDMTLPFQVAYFTFRKVKKSIKNNANDYQYVFLNLIRTAGYIELFDPNRVVIDIVDSIGLNYLRSKNNTASILHKIIYKIEAPRLIKFEKEIIAKAKLTLFVNRDEADYYSKYGKTEWLPNGVNGNLLEFNYQKSEYHKCICFFGAMFYQPNIDAVLWFIKNVMPSLPENVKFYIVGQKPAYSVLRAAKSNKNVVVTGFMENPYEILQSSLCNVAPMQTGGGIQNKILESMGLGQIVITNDLGVTPIIGAKTEENILVANRPEEFVNYINRLIQDRESFQAVGENARSLIKNNYSWENYKNKLLAYLEV